MSYDISIQPKDGKSVTQRASAESFIAALPGVRRESDGVFAYGDKRRRLFVHIYTGDSEAIDSIGASVPAAFTGSSGEQALLLCFQIADHLDWQVFDEQLGDYLDKSTAAEVLASQKDYGDSEEEVLRRRASGEASFGELYLEQFYAHGAVLLITTLVLAAVVAGYLVIERGMVQDRFPWLFFGAAVVLHAVRALIWTIWRSIRYGKKPAP